MIKGLFQKLTGKTGYEATRVFEKTKRTVFIVSIVVILISIYLYGKASAWHDYTTVRNGCRCGTVRLIEERLYSQDIGLVRAICE